MPSEVIVPEETGQDVERMAPPSLPPPRAGKLQAEPPRQESTETPPWVPTTWPADRIVEERLHRNEAALRAELHALPEVRLLSDQEVKDFRSEQLDEQDPFRAKLKAAAARRQAAQNSLEIARRNLNDARRSHRAVRNNPAALAYEQSATLAEAQAEADFALADRDYQLVAAASREAAMARLEATAKTAAERARMAPTVNLRLHQLLQRKAIQAGLDLQTGTDGPLDPSTARDMAELSRGLRTSGFVTFPARPTLASPRRRSKVTHVSVTPVSAEARMKALHKWCNQQHIERKSGTVPTLTQMLQIEDEASRLQLVRELTRIPSLAATTELAIRALVDVSPNVRQAALDELKQRPHSEYVPLLLRGLRYPWAPVADHAAFALRTLHPQETVTALVELLDLPSPSAPILDGETKRYTVNEVVRLNHMRNCLLCHAPSASVGDGLVRGFVPIPGKPLPPVEYYESQNGDFVRADITHLRQDFSLTFPALDVAPWPSEQRYDFVTRRRTLSLDPSQLVERRGDETNYPQREAVLYALRGITGKDSGDSSRKWRELLGIVKDERANLDKTIYKDLSLHPKKEAAPHQPLLDRPIAQTQGKASD